MGINRTLEIGVGDRIVDNGVGESVYNRNTQSNSQYFTKMSQAIHRLLTGKKPLLAATLDTETSEFSRTQQ